MTKTPLNFTLVTPFERTRWSLVDLAVFKDYSQVTCWRNCVFPLEVAIKYNYKTFWYLYIKPQWLKKVLYFLGMICMRVNPPTSPPPPLTTIYLGRNHQTISFWFYHLGRIKLDPDPTFCSREEICGLYFLLKRRKYSFLYCFGNKISSLGQKGYVFSTWAYIYNSDNYYL